MDHQCGWHRTAAAHTRYGRRALLVPDGTRIAYTPLSDPGYGLFASINLDGTDRKLLGNTDWESLGCAWTPDGRIVYSTRVGGYVSADWIINTDGTHRVATSSE